MMGVIKSLWASVQGNPSFMRRVNGWLTVFWIGMIPVSIMAGLLSSVSYVSALSLWALVSGHWSAWQAARVEVEQMAEADELQSHPIEKRVVEEIIDQTNVLRAEQSATAAGNLPSPQPNAPGGLGDRLASIAQQVADLQRELASGSYSPPLSARLPEEKIPDAAVARRTTNHPTVSTSSGCEDGR
jgi:hypothetical protein